MCIHIHINIQRNNAVACIKFTMNSGPLPFFATRGVQYKLNNRRLWLNEHLLWQRTLSIKIIFRIFTQYCHVFNVNGLHWENAVFNTVHNHSELNT